MTLPPAPGKVYAAAYALWRRDAHRGKRLDERQIRDTWPRVRATYMQAAELALMAANDAPDTLIAAQAALGHPIEAPTIKAGDGRLELEA